MDEIVINIENKIYGILGEGDQNISPGMLFVNPGYIYRIGPHRTYVNICRNLNNKGIKTLRWDLPSIGDSDYIDDKSKLELIDKIIGKFKEKAKLEDIYIFGICSGADQSINYIIKNDTTKVKGAILANPGLIDPRLDEIYDMAKRDIEYNVNCEVMNNVYDKLSELIKKTDRIKIIYSELSTNYKIYKLLIKNSKINQVLRKVELVIIPRINNVFSAVWAQKELNKIVMDTFIRKN